jgi:hypothetical protein
MTLSYTANQVYLDTVDELSGFDIMKLYNVAESEFLIDGLSKMSTDEIIHRCALIESNNFSR